MSAAAASPPRTLRVLVPAGIALALAACLWAVVYLYGAVPGPWVSSAAPQRFVGAQMTLSRGVGYVDESRIVVQATDATGFAIVSLDTPALLANDYRRIRWSVGGGQADVVLATIWRTDSAPGKIIGAPLESGPEFLQVRLTPGERNWAGRIEGIALTVRGTLRQPLTVEGVSVDPMGVADVIADRMHDWFDFRPWNGLSINSALGGPPEQAVWFPLAVTLIALTALGLCAAWRRRRPAAYPPFFLTIIAVTVAAWITLDARWLWSRVQQTQETAEVFAGKSPSEKHLSDLDANVFKFSEQIRARLNKTPARIYVTADDQYFGARLAYHLYPNNVYLNHDTGVLPPPAKCKPGEYIVVYYRRGVQYNRARQLIRWDEQAALPVELLISEDGALLFRLL